MGDSGFNQTSNTFQLIDHSTYLFAQAKRSFDDHDLLGVQRVVVVVALTPKIERVSLGIGGIPCER